MYALVDCNNFYVSCERVFQPQYNGKPVIVLSNNDGCAIARSEEAKALGIEMGAALHLVQDLVKSHDVKVFSSNYTLYGDMSSRVMHVLSSYARHIENYSIDESFLFLGDMKLHDLFKIGMKIRQQVKQWTGIPVSVGVAPTKTLAKLANRYAKKMHRDKGVYALDTKEKIEQVLKWCEIGDVWGIGRQYATKLQAMGIGTAYDFTLVPEEWVRKNMTVVGQRMYNELKSIPTIVFEEVAPAKKGICTSRSFGNLITDKDEIKKAVANHAAAVALKLRKQNSCTALIQVFLQTNPHRTQDKQFHRQLSWQIPTATSSTNLLIVYACQAIDMLYRRGYNYNKAGVVAVDIVPREQVQSSLWDSAGNVKNAAVMTTLDDVNKSMGAGTLKYSRQGYSDKGKLRTQYLSKCYTTRLEHIAKTRH
ncbi:MAG TPA: Y-family DNA polymerase [Flavisolibacter sp.]|nr:Y-family DNA polymerase [Flavisolibacter sp.]